MIEIALMLCLLLSGAPAREPAASVTVPFILDHNRMLVDVEIQRTDGSRRTARLWVDTGNPSFFMSEALARDLGTDLSAIGSTPMVPPPAHFRIGGMPLDFQGVESHVSLAKWQFNTMHNDGNLPSTVLRRYQVVFDYPARLLTIAEPGSLEHRGVRAPAAVNQETGIVQIDAVIDGDSLSFAVEVGAAYSFADSVVVARLLERHPSLPRITGAVGCANMWGWWPPDEQKAPVVRVSEIMWGPMRLAGVGVVGVPSVAPGGPPLGAWYSRKTARPVNGFLGPNAFKAFRVEIDYAGGAVYFEKTGEFDTFDTDLVGLTLRPEDDGSYSVLGVVSKDGKPAVGGVEPGDKLLGIGDLKTTGATMGTVVDALRGKPGDIRYLILERGGNKFRIEAKVTRLLP
ncbi:MAG: hypothetical protein NTW97_04215 [Candidatus Krumholzibacteria bacterium]|nr:hypothetical protein [Candidatus Krumholzibacteria bacterium]